MAWTGHYFKHSADGNWVTKTIEANNYFNLVSMLWNANTWIIPLIKLSYSLEHGACPPLAPCRSSASPGASVAHLALAARRTRSRGWRGHSRLLEVS